MAKDIKEIIAENTAAIMNEVITLKNANEEQSITHEKNIDEIFCEFITVIDTFERSEQTIKEKGLDSSDEASKAIKRLLNAKKKVLTVLEKYSVKPIVFPENHIIDELAITVGTEPDPDKMNGDIITIEKTGYTRCGRVIRPAEIIIVKN